MNYLFLLFLTFPKAVLLFFSVQQLNQLFLNSMRMSRNSHSRSKVSRRKYQCLPSVEVLHNGLKRKVSQNQYKSIYPRLRISDKSRVNTITILKNEFSEEYIHDQVLNMREENRKLEQENESLRTSIRRGNKLNDLFQRRRDNQELEKMQFQKLVELKLLLESQDLEQEFSRCQNRLKEAQKTHKNVKNFINNDNNSSQITFISLLTQIGFEAGQMKTKSQSKIANLNNHLFSIKLKTRKLKQLLKTKLQESKSLSEEMQSYRKKLPARFDANISVSDSGVIGLQVRNKSIDEIQNEIVKIKLETKKFEEGMQNQIDSHVLAKIILCREIDELKDKVAQKQLKKGRSIISW